MILASFPIKVFTANTFQTIKNERELSVLLQTHQYVRAAGGFVSNDRGQILMIFRLGVWDFPKGKTEAGETIEETAVREVLEETGIEATIVGGKTISVFHTYDTYGPKMLKETVWFEMKAVAGSTRPQTEEQIEQAVWVERDKVAELLKDSYASLREAWQMVETK